MNREAIDRLLHRWTQDALTNGDLAAFDDLLAEDVLDLSGPTPTRGRDSFKDRARAARTKLGAFTVEVDDVVHSGDALAWRWTLRTTSGAVMQGANFQRLANGRVIEHWTLVAPK